MRGLIVLTSALLLGAPAAAADRPNVLFIAIDDLRDWVGYLGDEQAKTPNLDRLAARGLHFTRSYCAAPVCNPSRTALLSGLRPGSTGVYENNADWRTTPAAKVTHLTQVFRAAGYSVTGAGKIYHGGYPPPEGYWDEFGKGKGEGDPDDVKPKGKGALKDTGWGFGNFQTGPIAGGDTSLPDYQIVEYCLKQLARKHDRPFLLACGLHKPHLPWRVPKKYFDMYPLDQIKLPEVKENELEGVPPAGVRMARPDGDHKTITEAGKWKECVQAYLATISYCDAMLGRLLDGFDRSPYRDNTIVVLWSDHGWHLGEKFHWRKFALWEQATRSPLIYAVPGLTKPGTVCHRTVDFMTTYPTLCDLCGLKTPEHVQGKSIRSLLADPGARWDEPAVTTYLFQNHAVRTEKWRYIRYANGDEELYDHDADPREWKNLAGDSKFAEVKTDLAAWLPKENKPDAGTKKR
jgi:arylsulfatase A-like enzyme